MTLNRLSSALDMRRTLALLTLATLPAAAETRLAIGSGEVFTYKVSWAVLPGAGEIKVFAQTEPNTSPAQLRVTTTTATRGVARVLLKFDANADSFFDVRTGRLLSLRETSDQGKKHSAHEVTFDYAAKRAMYSVPASTNPPRPLPMPAGEPMDLITQLIQTRSWDLKPGEKRDALVLFDDDFYELTIYAVRYEEVSTHLGDFKTIVLEPRMEKTPPKGMFKKGSTVHVWIARDDPRKLPVKFEVEFKIGTGVATLTNYQPPAAAPSPPKPAAKDEKNSNP